MDETSAIVHFAAGLAILLVIYASYMTVRESKGNLASAFRIILIGHIPLTLIHLVSALSDMGIIGQLFNNGAIHEPLNDVGEALSALSVFLAIYKVKKELYDKIVKFTGKFKREGSG